MEAILLFNLLTGLSYQRISNQKDILKMGLEYIAILVVITLLLLLFLGFPVAFSLLSVSVVYTIVFLSLTALGMLASITFGVITNEAYLALPLFIFMAAVLQFSGIADDLYDCLWKWLSGLRGGLSMATTVAITIIDAMTGIGATGIVTMGMIAFPQMEKHNYDRSISIGPIPVASALGPLIPPSTVMIILGAFAGLSIGELFIGGVVPGLIISSFFVAFIYVRCALNPKLAPKASREERASWKERVISLKGIILPILLVLLILGGIYSGATTPVEASAIGAFGAIICSIIYRKLTLENLKEAVKRTLNITVMAYWILIGGSSYAAFLSLSGVGGYLGNLFGNLPFSPMGTVVFFVIILLVLGMFLESLAIIMITVPIFFPVVESMGFDPVWFGVVFIIGIVIGYVTPPLGYNLFYIRAVIPSTISTGVIFRSVLYFIPFMIIALALVIIFPELILWLPAKMR